MKKTNNKGFSLVELIIVIAIMAILVGVLAPQYIKYVEKSRVSADKDLLDSIYNAITTAASDPDVDTDTILGTSGSLSDITIGTADNDFGKVVSETLGCTAFTDVTSKLKSKLGKGKGPADVKIDVDANGNYTVYIGTLNDPDPTVGITVGAGAK